ncbi:MAG TPA: rhodanese-like domain-containing protein [bacterium]
MARAGKGYRQVRPLAAALACAICCWALPAVGAGVADAGAGLEPAGGPADCFVPASVLRSRLQTAAAGKAPILVDVRDAASYGRARIPGSINVPLFAVKTKPFLRQASFVLVNDGFEGRRLLEECGALREQGFASVAVLKGGLSAWAAVGGAIVGDGSALAGVRSVPPQSLRAERAGRDVAIVDIRRGAGAAPGEELPGAKVLPYAGDARGFVERLDAEVGRWRAEGKRSVILVDEDGSAFTQLLTVIEETNTRWGGDPGLFFGEGGLQAYRGLVESQAKTLAGQRGKDAEGCKTCP